MFSKITKYVASSVMALQLFVGTVLAQTTPRDFIGSDISNQAGGDLLPFIRNVINLAIGLAGLVAVGVLVFNGVRYIVANGDDNKVEKATKGITYAVIGLIICFISILIVNFVLSQIIKV